MSDKDLGQNTDTHIDYALLEQLIDQHPDHSEEAILKLYQQHAEHATIALLSELMDEKAQLLLASALPVDKKPEKTHSQAQYKIDRRIDSGGQSHVYLAHRNDGTYSKTVVIKLLNQTIEGTTQKQQLMAEMQILADLRHPNIVTITDAGIDEQQRPWLMLDYIEGEHIDAYIKSNPLSFQGLLQLCLKVARALRYIHQQQVAHLDIKPANVMVEIIDGQVEPIIIDFGIAITQTVQSSSPYVFATPAFAAPEQLVTASAKTDHRCDIYAFGKLLEHLSRINEKAQSKHTKEETKSLIPIISRCTAATPENRFQDMQNVIDALSNLQHQSSAHDSNGNRLGNKGWQLKHTVFTSLMLLSLTGIVWLRPLANQSTNPVNQTKDSLHYWQSADEISNQTKLIYALPSRRIEDDFIRLNDLYSQLSTDLKKESKHVQTLSQLPMAKAAISLNRYQDAQQHLTAAAMNEPDNQEIQNLLGLNSLMLYQSEIQNLHLYSEPKQRQLQLDGLRTQYIDPVKSRFQSAAQYNSNEDLMAAGLWLHFNNHSERALELLRTKPEQDLWPVDRLLLAAQVANDLGQQNLNLDESETAKLYFSHALEFLNQLKSIARSHPGIQQQLCQTQSQWMQLNLPSTQWQLTGCDELLVLLPQTTEAILLAASAYANVAESWVSKGHDPNPIISFSRDIISRNNQSTDVADQARAERILGQTFNTQGLWLLYSGQEYAQAFKQAVHHHQNAAEKLPTDYDTQFDLGMAWYHLATNSPFHPTLTDQRFMHVENTFSALLDHADANPLLVSSLVRALTEHAYIKYQHGHAADQQLQAADALVQATLEQAKDSQFTHMAAATLYWTYVDYLALQQIDPSVYLDQAMHFFDLVIKQNNTQWTHRYNQISALLAAITYHLNNREDQTQPLNLVRQKLDHLAALVAAEVSLDSHLGYYNNMLAINLMLNGLSPVDALNNSQRHHQKCIKSPVDKRSCLVQLATQMITESRWKRLQPSHQLPQWEPRMRLLTQAITDHPELHNLTAQYGQLIYVNSQWQHLTTQERTELLMQSKQHLSQAIKNNRMLENRFAPVLLQVEQAIIDLPRKS